MENGKLSEQREQRETLIADLIHLIPGLTRDLLRITRKRFRLGGRNEGEINNRRRQWKMENYIAL